MRTARASGRSRLCMVNDMCIPLLRYHYVSGIATLKMHRKPVNGLNLEMLTDLNIALEKAENEKSCRGLVLTSVCSASVMLCILILKTRYSNAPE